jgi:hypothetical protein
MCCGCLVCFSCFAELDENIVVYCEKDNNYSCRSCNKKCDEKNIKQNINLGEVFQII